MPKRRALTEYQQKKHEKGLCIWFGCGQKKAKRKIHCCKHYHQDLKERRPLRYYFELHRCTAPRRGKVWKLTFKEFCKLVAKTDYMKSKGWERGLTLSLDCKKNELGYVKGNVGITTVSWNSVKSNRQMYVPYFRRQMEEAKYREQQYAA